MLWAREMRGIASIANAVAPVAAIRSQALGVRARGEEADEDVLGGQPARVAAGGHADDRLGLVGVAEPGAGLLVVGVGDRGLGARAGLEHDLVARRGELAHDVGNERHAALAGGRLGGDSDPQGSGTVPEASGDRRDEHAPVR